MIYNRTNWSENTPITAEKLNNIETGVAGAATLATQNENKIKSVEPRVSTLETKVTKIEPKVAALETRGTAASPFGDFRTQTLFSNGDISTYGNMWLNNSILYNPRKIIQQNAPIDIETKGGVGIKGGSLYLNGNSIVYTRSLTPLALVKDIEFTDFLGQLQVIPTETGLGLTTKADTVRAAASPEVDLVTVIAALVAKVQQL